MKYEIRFVAKAYKELSRIAPVDRKRIEAKLMQLAQSPHDSGLDVKRLTASEYSRLRVGNYRVIYEVIDAKLVVQVVDVGHRRKIYH